VKGQVVDVVAIDLERQHAARHPLRHVPVRDAVAEDGGHPTVGSGRVDAEAPRHGQADADEPRPARFHRQRPRGQRREDPLGWRRDHRRRLRVVQRVVRRIVHGAVDHLPPDTRHDQQRGDADAAAAIVDGAADRRAAQRAQDRLGHDQRQREQDADHALVQRDDSQRQRREQCVEAVPDRPARANQADDRADEEGRAEERLGVALAEGARAAVEQHRRREADGQHDAPAAGRGQRLLEALRIEIRRWQRCQIHRAALQVWRRSRITSVWS